MERLLHCFIFRFRARRFRSQKPCEAAGNNSSKNNNIPSELVQGSYMTRPISSLPGLRGRERSKKPPKEKALKLKGSTGRGGESWLVRFNAKDKRINLMIFLFSYSTFFQDGCLKFTPCIIKTFHQVHPEEKITVDSIWVYSDSILMHLQWDQFPSIQTHGLMQNRNWKA